MRKELILGTKSLLKKNFFTTLFTGVKITLRRTTKNTTFDIVCTSLCKLFVEYFFVKIVILFFLIKSVIKPIKIELETCARRLSLRTGLQPFLKQSQSVDVSREGNRSIFVEVIGEGVEVTRGRGNFDTLTKQKKRGLDVGKWQKCQCQHLDPDFRQPHYKKKYLIPKCFLEKKNVLCQKYVGLTHFDGR